MNPLSRQMFSLLRRWQLLVCIVGFVASQQAIAFAFVLDPQTDPNNNPFGRVLWKVTPNNKQIILNYAFVPQQKNEYVWVSSNGQRVSAVSKGWTDKQEQTIKRAADTWTAGVGKKNNLKGSPTNREADLESTALHEFGHAIGLGHPEDTAQTSYNNGTRKTVHVASQNNLNVNGTPLTEPVPPADKTNIRQSNILQAEDAQVRPLAKDATGTEAVMIQLSLIDEIQRDLAFDDEQGLHALQSGRDFIVNTGDDYVIVMRQVPYNSGQQQINIINTELPFDVGGRTNYSTVKTNIFNDPWRINPNLIDKSLLQMDYLVDELTGDPKQILGATDVWVTYPTTEYGTEIGGAHIFLDADHMYVPEPGTLSILALGLLAVAATRASQRASF